MVIPKLSFQEIHAYAGQQVEKLRGRLVKNSHIGVEFHERRLVPFWHILCRSLIEYDRLRVVGVSVSSSDVANVIIRSDSGEQISIASNGSGRIDLHTIEQCERRVNYEEYIDDYHANLGKKAWERLPFIVGSRNWQTYRSSNIREIEDVEDFVKTGGFESEYERLGYKQNDLVRVVRPIYSANKIVSETLQKITKDVKREKVVPKRIALAIENVDLYFRPVCVFRFLRYDKKSLASKPSHEEIDAVTGEWGSEPELGFNPNVSSDVRDTLFLTTDIATELMKLAGPIAIVAAEISKSAIHKFLDRD